MNMIFKTGDKVVSRFGGHHVVTKVEVDGENNEWITVKRLGVAKDAEFLSSEFRPYVCEFHGPWEGPQS